jgi:hypothetical protein
MGIKYQKTPAHWNYFLAIEQDVINLSRYIEFTESNYKTHSIEVARILFTASSEADVVAKALCRTIEPNSRAGSINAYKNEIKQRYLNFPETEVQMPRYGLTLTPWSEWKKDDTPIWWTSYNKVKHHRDSHFERASLKNALNAFSGLFVLLLYLYQDELIHGQINPLPSVITYPPWGGGDLGFQV